MARASERQKQKKREKQQRKRKQAKAQAAAKQQAQALPTSERGLVKLASEGEFGPAWIHEAWDTPEGLRQPVLIVITRRLRGRLYLAHCVYVDRTCLGIRDAFTLAPADEHELAARLAEVSREHEKGVIPCDVAVAQSVVFHALDYSKSLGFRPHRDFHPSMIEPRPAELLDTPGAHPERPAYYPSPGEDIGPILAKLDKAVGRGNYDFTGIVTAPSPLDVGKADAGDFPEEPPDLPWHPADAGADPTRIDWKAACTRVPWAPPLLPQALPVRDLRPDPDDFERSRFQAEDIDTFMWELEEGRHHLWEAVLRREQSLPLTPEHEQILAQLLGDEGGRIELLGELPRPCEPWYQTFDRMLDATLVDRVETHELDDDDDQLTQGCQLVDVVEEHAVGLSLPPGISSLDELLDDARVSRARVQVSFGALVGLGQKTPHDGPISLADPDELGRVDDFIAALREAKDSLARLGWGLREVLEIVVLPDDQRALLLEAIGSRTPELLVGMG